jgi:hypothetical protein
MSEINTDHEDFVWGVRKVPFSDGMECCKAIICHQGYDLVQALAVEHQMVFVAAIYLCFGLCTQFIVQQQDSPFTLVWGCDISPVTCL